MTIPNERTNAVLNTEEFLIDLLMPSITPKVPKYVREWASMLLKHYPSTFDMARTASKCSEIFGKTERTDKYLTRNKHLRNKKNA